MPRQALFVPSLLALAATLPAAQPLLTRTDVPQIPPGMIINGEDDFNGGYVVLDDYAGYTVRELVQAMGVTTEPYNCGVAVIGLANGTAGRWEYYTGTEWADLSYWLDWVNIAWAENDQTGNLRDDRAEYELADEYQPDYLGIDDRNYRVGVLLSARTGTKFALRYVRDPMAVTTDGADVVPASVRLRLWYNGPTGADLAPYRPFTPAGSVGDLWRQSGNLWAVAWDDPHMSQDSVTLTVNTAPRVDSSVAGLTLSRVGRVGTRTESYMVRDLIASLRHELQISNIAPTPFADAEQDVGDLGLAVHGFPLSDDNGNATGTWEYLLGTGDWIPFPAAAIGSGSSDLLLLRPTDWVRYRSNIDLPEADADATLPRLLLNLWDGQPYLVEGAIDYENDWPSVPRSLSVAADKPATVVPGGVVPYSDPAFGPISDIAYAFSLNVFGEPVDNSNTPGDGSDPGDTVALAPPSIPTSGGYGPPLYFALGPATPEGLAAIKRAVKSTTRSEMRAYSWDPTISQYVEMLAEPAGGLTVASGIFIATRIPLDINLSGSTQASPYDITIQPGNNFIAPPVLKISGTAVSTHPWSQYAIYETNGSQELTGGDRVAALGNGVDEDRPWSWDGSAYSRADTLVSGKAYWVRNRLSRPLLLRREVTLRNVSVNNNALRLAARAASDVPPPPPGAGVAADAPAGGGCGSGAGIAGVLVAGLALFGRRRQRRV